MDGDLPLSGPLHRCTARKLAYVGDRRGGCLVAVPAGHLGLRIERKVCPMDSVSTIAWNVSYLRRDGGGIRVDAFLEGLKRIGVVATQMGIGPESLETSAEATTSRLGDLKRHLLPVPLRGRAVRGFPHSKRTR